MRELIITDLEEQILFLLQMHETRMSLVDLTNKASSAAGKMILMANVHQTILGLENRGFVMIEKVNKRTQYIITAIGREALHEDWSYYNTRRWSYE